jgi:hypothetical protein
MKSSLLQALERRRPAICARWEALLRLEKAPTALARPDTLVFHFDQTLSEVLSPEPEPEPAGMPDRPVCRCDCNPFRHYFATLEQALLETLIWAQVEEPELSLEERVASVGELCQRLRRVAEREIRLLDGVCPNAAANQLQT